MNFVVGLVVYVEIISERPISKHVVIVVPSDQSGGSSQQAVIGRRCDVSVHLTCMKIERNNTDSVDASKLVTKSGGSDRVRRYVYYLIHSRWPTCLP
jgi:hypothetical protein